MAQVAVPVIGCYIGFDLTANAGSWALAAGVLGTSTILGPAYTTAYTDVGADVLSIKINRGKSRERDLYQAGRCTVVLNNIRRDYDPLNLAGPYVTGGVTDVKPGRLIYITATDPTTGIVERLFTGRIRNWKPAYTGAFYSEVTVEATDSMTDLASVELGGYVSSAAKMGTVAAAVMVQAGVTDFVYDEGLFDAQSMTWNGRALAALRVLETSEQAELFVEANGDLRFASQTSLVTELRSRLSQATFGAGNLKVEKVAIDYDSDRILNDVDLTRVGGVVQSASDAVSVAAYGPKSLATTGLANLTDLDVLSIANQLVARYSEPAVRILGVTFHPRKHGDLMTQALTRRLRDRVTVTFSPVGGGSAISEEVFITNIAHTIRAGQDMETSFGFSSTAFSHGWLLGTDALGSATLGL